MANDTIATVQVKTEFLEPNPHPRPNRTPNPPASSSVIYLTSSSDSDDSSSSDDSDDDDDTGGNLQKKFKRSTDEVNKLLPPGFLDPLPSQKQKTPLATRSEKQTPQRNGAVADGGNKQFWKAGDYEGSGGGDWNSSSGGMDHVRVHPRFLHSNATSHKWVLGAFAELLDNALDEVASGATYVNIDMVKSKKDGTKMLLIEDDGGGMDPDKMRHCMSLGYSAKSKMINTIGQYGNGFKTSTMRLGADVIVFSRNRGKDGRPTQSIGLLSYTFLRSTRKEDIVVPMLDYKKSGENWNKIVRSSDADWNINLETLVQWSPFTSEADLLRQFNHMKDHGTRIFIYNLWEDDEGLLELDFETDPHDIQIRGVNRDEKSIEMAKKHPNSKHFLTYYHSLRSYAAILYLRVPPVFRMILRGKDVEHHNIVNDMMMSQEIVYRPQPGSDGIPKDSNMVAVVTVGFVKDAKDHIDVQGFNVYHKNRLIKPFWRVWSPPGSDGRGVIGVLEANFVEPAHDKQGFERTTVLARLEAKLVIVQRNYWTSNCDKIGYAPRRAKKALENDDSFVPNVRSKNKSFEMNGKTQSKLGDKGFSNGHLNGKDVPTPRNRPTYAEPSSSVEEVNDNDWQNYTPRKRAYDSSPARREAVTHKSTSERPDQANRTSNSKEDRLHGNGHLSSSASPTLSQLKKENLELRERLKRKEDEILGEVLNDLLKEKEKCNSLEAQLEDANTRNEKLIKEKEDIINILAEERQRRDMEEDNLKQKLEDAKHTIKQLVDKIKLSGT